MITAQQHYHPTSAVGSKFSWGHHDLQTGQTFNDEAWNNIANASPQAWGLQELGQPMNLQQAMGILQGQPGGVLTPQEQAYLATLDPVAAHQFLSSRGLV
jgi:hypothetical protein